MLVLLILYIWRWIGRWLFTSNYSESKANTEWKNHSSLMATTFFFLLLSAIFIAKAQQGQSNVNPGSFLTPTTNSSWPSPSGRYAFGFYKQGNGYAVGVFFCWDSRKDCSLDSQPRRSSSSCCSCIEFHKWWTFGSAIGTRHNEKCSCSWWNCKFSIHAWYRQLCCL